MSIYTKKGDKGKTFIYKKEKGKSVGVSKGCLLIEAIGTVDELNSFLGVVTAFLKDKNIIKILRSIQSNLFTIGAMLSGADLHLESKKVEELEQIIDRFEKKLPHLKNFIIPDGNKASSLIHYARSLARRMEREIVRLGNKESFDKTVIKYANRLSDLLFVLARSVSYKSGKKEDIWSV